VELLVLVDRGHRELPIQADYCGKRLETAETDRVDVLVQERDGQDAIVLSRQD
jgi:pyrimidine operon attenuation protein/uracil phosphoribosyltransferase